MTTSRKEWNGEYEIILEQIISNITSKYNWLNQNMADEYGGRQIATEVEN